MRPNRRLIQAMIYDRQRLCIEEANFLRSLIGMPAIQVERDSGPLTLRRQRRLPVHGPDWRSRYRHPEHAARRRGAVIVEAFSKQEIYDRDGGRCHLCGTSVDPREWDLDHVLPLSRGGVHSRTNVAVSHPWCNRARGNRPIQRQPARAGGEQH